MKRRGVSSQAKATDKDALNYARICEGKVFYYSVCEDGLIIRTSKKRCSERRVAVFLKDGKATVKINGKMHIVKHLVAKHFLRGYKKGDNVILKDGNPRNCDINNLTIISKSELGKITGGDSRRKAVFANEVEYYSVRECAKSLNCSYQTLLDFLNGKVKNSVLSGNDIRYIN